jgi:hypothetical protein
VSSLARLATGSRRWLLADLTGVAGANEKKPRRSYTVTTPSRPVERQLIVTGQVHDRMPSNDRGRSRRDVTPQPQPRTPLI